MIISVASLRKGMGQTITAINIGIMLSMYQEQRCLLIDTNSSFSDAETYLSNTLITKGLDEFCNLYNANLLTEDRFGVCTKKVYRNLEFMAAGTCFKPAESHIKTLLKYAGSMYGHAVIDLDGYKGGLQRTFLDGSDVILVVLNQMKSIMDYLYNNRSTFERYKHKLVFVLNRYRQPGNDFGIMYNLDDVRKDLADIGFCNEVFRLDYDVQLVNECNRCSLLNYTLNNKDRKSSYNKQLDFISRYIASQPLQNKNSSTPSRNIFSNITERFRSIIEAVQGV